MFLHIVNQTAFIVS